MDITPLLDQLSAINPWWAALAAAIVVLIRTGTIVLPWKLPLVTPADVHPHGPLLDRLQVQIAARFDELVDAGSDPDDVYGFLVTQVRDHAPVLKGEGK